MKDLTNIRNIGIDLLRSLCILYIVGFWHLLGYTEPIPKYDNFITLRITYILLGTFTFISGYYIGLKNTVINKQSLIQFYKKRFLRVYPLYFIAIGLFTILHLSDFDTSIKAALIISMFAQPATQTLWYITMLMLFYSISPLIIIGYQKKTLSKLIIYCFIFIPYLKVILEA